MRTAPWLGQPLVMRGCQAAVYAPDETSIRPVLKACLLLSVVHVQARPRAVRAQLDASQTWMPHRPGEVLTCKVTMVTCFAHEPALALADRVQAMQTCGYGNSRTHARRARAAAQRPDGRRVPHLGPRAPQQQHRRRAGEADADAAAASAGAARRSACRQPAATLPYPPPCLPAHCVNAALFIEQARRSSVHVVSRRMRGARARLHARAERRAGRQENTMVKFRGDALHSIDNFQSPGGTPRVSLVLKQYRLSPGDYAFCPEFVVGAW